MLRHARAFVRACACDYVPVCLWGIATDVPNLHFRRICEKLAK